MYNPCLLTILTRKPLDLTLRRKKITIRNVVISSIEGIAAPKHENYQHWHTAAPGQAGCINIYRIHINFCADIFIFGGKSPFCGTSDAPVIVTFWLRLTSVCQGLHVLLYLVPGAVPAQVLPPLWTWSERFGTMCLMKTFPINVYSERRVLNTLGENWREVMSTLGFMLEILPS